MIALRQLVAAAATLICICGLPAAAQDTGAARSEILVVDPERLFEESQLGQRMMAEHQDEREELAAHNRKLEAELETEERALTARRAELSPEEFRELADAFDARVQEIRRDSERRVRDLEQDRERLPLLFLRQAEPVLIEAMRNMGGVVLLDARTVMLRADAVDITDDAVARIDETIGDGETAPEEEAESPAAPAPQPQDVPSPPRE
ncbi:OmpH family outer membrane protein [Roseovarius amoyensis]|uniref:OmpH family outer membrane protein n=1 Tax=Roseovarius amoyensis TaxID=2211448 RepID=UPI0013A70079|nr:OmpH family outer membrane protein [Roseovarius amoyensis]